MSDEFFVIIPGMTFLTKVADGNPDTFDRLTVVRPDDTYDGWYCQHEGCLVYPFYVFAEAIIQMASKNGIVHNHPTPE